MCIEGRTSLVRRWCAALGGVIVVTALLSCADGGATGPGGARFTGELDGVHLRLDGWAGLVQASGAPDTLILVGHRSDLAISLQVEFHGPGVYPLREDNVEMVLLVGGDGRTGGYGGSAPARGGLRVTQRDRAGSPLQAELWFDATHSGGEQRFGATVAFRNGQLTTQLETVPR